MSRVGRGLFVLGGVALGLMTACAGDPEEQRPVCDDPRAVAEGFQPGRVVEPEDGSPPYCDCDDNLEHDPRLGACIPSGCAPLQGEVGELELVRDAQGCPRLAGDPACAEMTDLDACAAREVCQVTTLCCDEGNCACPGQCCEVCRPL